MGIIKIEWRNCSLWAQMAPCCEWVEIGRPCSSGSLDEPFEESVQLSACGRAFAIGSKLRAVGETMWSQRDNAPWGWVSAIKAAHPDLAGGDAEMVRAMLAIALLYPVGGYGAAFDDSDHEELICRIEAGMSASAAPLSDAEWDAVKGAILGTWGVNVPVVGFWQKVLFAIGRGDISDVAIMGASNTGATCDCPDEPYHDQWSDPTAAGWYLGAPSEDLTLTSNTGPDWTRVTRQHTLPHDIYGVVWELVRVSGDDDIKQMSEDCGAYPIWSNTSETFPNSHPRYASGAGSVLTELFGAGNYVYKSGAVSWSADVGSPRYPAGRDVCENWQIYNGVGSTAIIRALRFIHNVNSASHA